MTELQWANNAQLLVVSSRCHLEAALIAYLEMAIRRNQAFMLTKAAAAAHLLLCHHQDCSLCSMSPAW